MPQLLALRLPLLLAAALLLLLQLDGAAMASACVDTPLPISRDVCTGLGFGSDKPGSNCQFIAVVEKALAVGVTCSQGMITPVSSVGPAGQALPYPIKDLRPLPASFKTSDMLGTEGPNYYFFHRVVTNFMYWSPCTVLPNVTTPVLPIPDGWTLLRTINSTQAGLPGNASSIPLVAVMRKAGVLGVFVRGTQTDVEGTDDAMYQHANTSVLWGFRFPGATHTGFTKLANEMWDGGLRAVMDEQLRSAPSSIVVTGYSLGSGVGTLLAYMIKATLNKYFPRSNISVDAYLFAAPNAGDRTFARAFNKQVNARRPRFTFDVVPQVPCAPRMVACGNTMVDTSLGGSVNSWSYQAVGGVVELGVGNMAVQQEVWGRFKDLSLCETGAFLTATHTCSYYCAFSPYSPHPGFNCMIQNATASDAATNATYCGAGFGPSDSFPKASGYPR